ncbi:MAG: hypothetical protein ABIH90_00925 [Candidatus Aenigmatarchaeota archaeon]
MKCMGAENVAERFGQTWENVKEEVMAGIGERDVGIYCFWGESASEITAPVMTAVINGRLADAGSTAIARNFYLRDEVVLEEPETVREMFSHDVIFLDDFITGGHRDRIRERIRKGYKNLLDKLALSTITGMKSDEEMHTKAAGLELDYEKKHGEERYRDAVRHILDDAGLPVGELTDDPVHSLYGLPSVRYVAFQDGMIEDLQRPVPSR